jgi:signal transduction histidine kinase
VVGCLINLIQNGRRHGLPPIEVSLSQNGASMGFEVRDHGAGIPVYLREKVFEPFFRGAERAGGSGLGLAIVRQLVERHGGSVVIHDAAPGCRVLLRLPSSASDPA